MVYKRQSLLNAILAFDAGSPRSGKEIKAWVYIRGYMPDHLGNEDVFDASWVQNQATVGLSPALLSHVQLASFPGSSAPEREIEFMHVDAKLIE